MEGDKIRCIIKREDEGIGHVTAVSDRLKNWQGHVGGMVEAVTDPSREFVILCNEEGRLIGLPYNCTVELTDGRLVPFFGDIVVVGISEDGSEFADLPEKYTRKWWMGRIQ